MIWFIPFLAIIFLFEVFQNIYFKTTGRSTMLYSQIAGLIAFAFYSFFFFNVTRNRSYRYVICIVSLLYIMAVVGIWCVTGLSYVLFAKLNVFAVSLITGGFLLTIYSGMLFYQYLQQESLPDDKQQISYLWVAAGILIFYSGIEIYLASMPHIKKQQLTLFGTLLYNAAPRLLSVILYSFIIISFYKWRIRQK